MKTVLFVCLALLLFVSGSLAATAAWSSFLHDAQNSLSTSLPGPSAPPKVVWTRPVTNQAFLRAAVGSDGTIYTSDDNILSAWDSKGNAKWTFTESTYLSHVVLIQETNTIYITAERTLYLINSLTGKSIKNISLEDSGDRITPFSIVVSSSGIAYFSIVNENGPSPVAAIYAINPTAGDPILWKTDIDFADVSYDEHLALTADNKVLVASALVCTRTSCDVYAQGYDCASGNLMWLVSFPVSYHFAVAPTISADGIVYLTASSTYALNATTGQFLWVYNSDGVAFSATSGGLLFTHSFYTGDVSIIDQNGKNVKNITLNGVKVTDLVVSTGSNALYVTGITGNNSVIAHIDLKNYYQDWQITIPNNGGGALAIAPANTLLLVGSSLVSLA